jgi:hypothetical protein
MDQSTGNGNSGFERAARPSPDRTLTDIIKEEPIACLAIAAAVGFLVGGGAKRQGGLTILTMLGQIVVREALGNGASLSDLIEEPQGKST